MQPIRPGWATTTISRGSDVPGVFDSVAAVRTTGKIKKPLITVAGTMDALLVIQHQARAYEAAVNASRKGNNDERNAQYRLYEVQNGNHIESNVIPFPQLVVIQPHAQTRVRPARRARRDEFAATSEPMHSEGWSDFPDAFRTGPLRQPVRAVEVPNKCAGRREAASPFSCARRAIGQNRHGISRGRERMTLVESLCRDDAHADATA